MQHRDLLITNAVVRSVDAQDSVHDAVLISNGKIAAVGHEEVIRAAGSRDTEIFDAGGRTVVPGFIDAHNHMSDVALKPLSVDCATPPMETLDEVLSTIGRHCAGLPAGQWVRGVGFHFLKVREQRGPTRWELDEVAPNNPFVLKDSSGHASYVNSAALQATGFNECTPDPWGGHIDRDPRGRPTGTLYEAATNWVNTDSMEDYARRDRAGVVGLIAAKAKEYLQVGITAIGDACVTPLISDLYSEAAAAGLLPITVQQLHASDHYFSQQTLRRQDIVDRILAPQSQMLRGGTMKVFVDRAYPTGAARHQRRDGCSHHVGQNYYSQREVAELVTDAGKHKVNLAMHAMGDCAVDIVMDAFESSRRENGDNHILRIEHAFVSRPDQGQRMASLGIDLVANPGLGYNDSGLFSSWRGEGQHHLKVLPLRSMIDAGARVSFASDHPCGIVAPAEIMWVARARRNAEGELFDPEEAVTGAEALRAYTINPAMASGRGDEEGSIEVGKRANVLVLDRDPVTCTVDELRALSVDRTYVDGQLVHERCPQPAA